MAVFGLEGIYVDGTVGGLGGYELVERVPGDALDVVIVFCDLADQGAWDGQSA